MDEQVLTPTPAAQWKGAVRPDGTDLPLPSGNVARIKKINPQVLMNDKGLIPDPLSDIVAKAVHRKRGLPPSKVKEMSEDPEKVQASFELFDRVLCRVMVEPVAVMPPKCTKCGEYANIDDRHTDREHAEYHPYREGARDKDVLYADQVDLVDKIFIFQWCVGGTSDLESFRQQLPSSMAALPDR